VTRVPRYLLLLAALALLAFPAPAGATPFQVSKYSNEELTKALDNLPSDIDEYSDCREVISAAITGGSDRGANRGAGGGGDGSGGGSAAPITPEEQAARAQDQADLQALTTPDGRDKPPAVEVGGETVKPGSDGLFDLASESNSIPGPLLAALIALGILALVGGVVALRGRVPALARLPLLSKIPTPRVSLPRFRR
jgi:hypothetical protein